MLISPLKHLGFKIDTFVVRLFLTLQYVEYLATEENKQKLSFEQLDVIEQSKDSLPLPEIITFVIMPLRMADKLAVGFLILIMVCLLVMKFSFLRQW
jgi:hypothetical protein